VEKLWTDGAKPVERLTTKKNLRPDRGAEAALRRLWTSLRAALRLIVAVRRVGSVRHVPLHCFEETIGERAFEIEVTAAGNRWRAQLRRRPGIPTAMMPFYGASPAEAARRLIDWMRRAHERQFASADGATKQA
jgi:hypothetical protein